MSVPKGNTVAWSWHHRPVAERCGGVGIAAVAADHDSDRREHGGQVLRALRHDADVRQHDQRAPILLLCAGRADSGKHQDTLPLLDCVPGELRRTRRCKPTPAGVKASVMRCVHRQQDHWVISWCWRLWA